MKPGKRFGLSAEQKIDVWSRWKVGQTLHEIGRAFGKEHSSIRCLVSRHGGIAPAVRRRALFALTLREREEISRGLASGSSMREIAKCLERAVSTVSREVARHGGRPAYRASQADGEAWQWALRPKRCLLSIHLKLRNIVASKLMLDWSPKQISGWLKPSILTDESNACVPRNHLPQPVHSSPWSAWKRSYWSTAIQASHTPVANTLVSSKTAAVESPSCHLDPSERPAEAEDRCHSRAPGRRSPCAAQGTVTSRLWWNAHSRDFRVDQAYPAEIRRKPWGH